LYKKAALKMLVKFTPVLIYFVQFWSKEIFFIHCAACRCQFHHHFTGSFCVRRSQKLHVNMLVKSTPGVCQVRVNEWNNWTCSIQKLINKDLFVFSHTYSSYFHQFWSLISDSMLIVALFFLLSFPNNFHSLFLFSSIFNICCNKSRLCLQN